MFIPVLQVVKNVASKNIEVKKLVYVYLTRYAEEQQDLALLSISTFQVVTATNQDDLSYRPVPGIIESKQINKIIRF